MSLITDSDGDAGRRRTPRAAVGDYAMDGARAVTSCLSSVMVGSVGLGRGFVELPKPNVTRGGW